METVYVFGHKNPDTDTVCSAIAYAHLKNAQADGTYYAPACLGELNRETRFVLDTFDVPEPEYLPHIYVRVQDVMTRDVVSASSEHTVLEVGELMRTHEIHAVPVVDGSGRALGVVTERHLARSYLKELQVQNLSDAATPLDKIAHTLDGQLLVGDPGREVKGNVFIGAMSPESMIEYITPGDLVILGNRENAQLAALKSGISCLIVSGGFDPSRRVQQAARKRGAAVILTPYDTFGAARRINLSVSVMTLLERNVLTARPGTLAQEVAQDLLESRLGIVLVTDENGNLEGVVTKSDIVARHRRPVILVDHSEESQAIDGIRQAEIREILDHHRLGGLETAGPMMALIAPVGCTATLILRRYKEARLPPSRSMAGLMLSAILSDTMLLKSPTTTPEDKKAVAALGKMLEEDPMAFGRRMYNAKFDMAALSTDEMITRDLKTFAFGGGTVSIAQIEVGDKAVILERKAEVLAAMRQFQEQRNLALAVLLVTDIPRGGSELLAVGRTRAVERAFEQPLSDGSMYLPGVMSRKKQVVPPIANAF